MIVRFSFANKWRSLSVAVFFLPALLVIAKAERVIAANKSTARPNILFAMADDWGWPHAGAYGDPVVKTPTFDKLAREGVLFRHAYVSSPSCTPSRGAILTGQWHWRLGGAGNLWSVFPDSLTTYPEILQKAGYVTGASGKGWGPGRTATKNRPVAGKRYKNFAQFLKQRTSDKPFCYWLGTGDPHRPYKPGSGVASGMKLDKIRLAACFPDCDLVRSDVADYYFEVQRFDRLVGEAVAALAKNGELENTIIVMTGDHGMPFPRGKSNLYDTGTRVPLAIRWGDKVVGHRVVDDFISLTDLAPTFLEMASIQPPQEMTGKSLISLLSSNKSGLVNPNRNYVLTGKERHVPGQEKPDYGGYPCRAIRTTNFLYIRNFKPERWPSGTPNYELATIPGAWLADCDNGPTKTYMWKNRDRDAQHRLLYDLSFGKRPSEELYDLKSDPDQLKNVGTDAKYAKQKQKLAAQLTAQLRATGDPRVVGGGEKFDTYKYLGSGPRFPGWRKKRSGK